MTANVPSATRKTSVLRPFRWAQERLWQRSRDNSGPVVIVRSRIYILPSRAGLLFALVLLTMLVGAINYDLSLGHALTFLLAGIGLAAMLRTFRNLLDLRLDVGNPEPVFAGDPALFPIHLENLRSTAREGLEIGIDRDQPVICRVAADAIADLHLPVPTTKRGWYALPRLRIATRYPLGLYYAWAYAAPPRRGLVYPRPHFRPLPDDEALLPTTDGRGSAGLDDFAGLRVRQPADALRHVAWKAAARDPEHRQLLVKQFAGGARSEYWLEWRQVTDDNVEERLAVLASWAIDAEHAGLHYGLRLPDSVLAPGHGEGHLHACLRALALHPA
jgi:uncharacterized protein (DUF58 family)